MANPPNELLDEQDFMAATTLDQIRNYRRSSDEMRQADYREFVNSYNYNYPPYEYFSPGYYPTSVCCPYCCPYGCPYFSHSSRETLHLQDNAYNNLEDNLIPSQSDQCRETMKQIKNNVDEFHAQHPEKPPSFNNPKIPALKNPEERKFVCQHMCCGKTYIKKAHLRNHMRTHTGERPYVCSWTNCGRRFTRSDELCRHYRCHTGEKRYKCKHCPMAFIRKDHMDKHISRRHP